MAASASSKETQAVPLKILDHGKWPSEIMTLPLKWMASSAPLKQEYALNRSICQIHCICKIHGCTSFSGVSIVDFENVNACLGEKALKSLNMRKRFI